MGLGKAKWGQLYHDQQGINKEETRKEKDPIKGINKGVRERAPGSSRYVQSMQESSRKI